MKLDDITKTASLLGGFIIFLGGLYLHSYYYYFGIPIFRYLDLSDILVAFLRPLIFIVLFFVSILVLMSVLFPIGIFAAMGIQKLYHLIMLILRKQMRVYKPRTSRNHEFFITANAIWLGIYSVLCLLSFLWFYVDSDLYFDDMWFFLMEISATSIALQFLHKNSESMKIVFANIILTFLISTLHSSAEDIQEARTGIDYSRTTYFITDVDTIQTDTFRHYIGKTNAYIFLYDNQNKNVEIYPTSNIKRVFMLNSAGSFLMNKKDTLKAAGHGM